MPPSSHVSTIAPSISVSTETVALRRGARGAGDPVQRLDRRDRPALDREALPVPPGPVGPAGPVSPRGPGSPFAPAGPGAPSLPSALRIGPAGPAGPFTFQLSACSDRLHVFPADGISSTPDLCRHALITPSSSVPPRARGRTRAADRERERDHAERDARAVSAFESVSSSFLLVAVWRSRDSHGRRRRLVSETARTGRNRRFCAPISTHSTHFRDRAPLPRPRPAPSSRRRPPRPPAARAAAARADAERPRLGADGGRPRRRALRVPARADRPRRPQRVDPRPGEPEARVGAVGRQVRVGGARLRAARVGRDGSGRQAGVGHDPEPDSSRPSCRR